MVRLTLKDKRNIINDCDNDKPSAEAKRYGVSRQAVNYILRKAESFKLTETEETLKRVINNDNLISFENSIF